MMKYLLAVLLVAVSGQGLAGGITPAAPGKAGAASAVQPAYARSVAAPEQSDHSSSRLTLPKDEHLRIAAEHLEAAGLNDEAQRVRQTAGKKQPPTQIIINVRIVELSLTKLANLGFDVKLLSKLQLAGAPGGANVFAMFSDPKLLALIETLIKDHVGKVVSEPSLCVVPGRPAFMLVGGEIAYPTEDWQGKKTIAFKEYGTRMDVVANLASKDHIRLDTRIRVSNLDAANALRAGEYTIPALKTREIETALDIRPGQTIALGGAVEERSVAVAAAPSNAGDKPAASGAPREVRHVTEKVQYFVLVKAEIATEGLSKSDSQSCRNK
jgi:Flp pilus assembly secretin CpaC